jgi:hypothetical protein
VLPPSHAARNDWEIPPTVAKPFSLLDKQIMCLWYLILSNAVKGSKVGLEEGRMDSCRQSLDGNRLEALRS